MLELLFLLLPVAAAYGWYMGRRSAQQNKQDEANRLSRDYVAVSYTHLTLPTT